MSGVTTTLLTLDGDEIASAVTDYTGTYEFTNIPAGDYVVTFYTEEEAGGVEIDDAYMILQYLDEEIELTPIQELAADVNGNGIINMADHNQIVNHYLNHGTPFPVGPWVFENDTITIPAESRDADGTGRLGSSSGDVNGSLQPDPKKNQIFLENPVLDLELKPEDLMTFDLSCAEYLELTGLHLAFRIPYGLDIMSIESPVQNLTYSIREGVLRITCLNNTREIFEIRPGIPVVSINAHIAGNQQTGSINLAMCDESHFMGPNGVLISGLKFELPVLNYSIQKTITHSAYPNPFISLVHFDYELQEAGTISIMIFDQYGRMVREINEGSQNAGMQQTQLDCSDLAPGIYHYSVCYSGHQNRIETGQLLKTK